MNEKDNCIMGIKVTKEERKLIRKYCNENSTNYSQKTRLFWFGLIAEDKSDEVNK